MAGVIPNEPVLLARRVEARGRELMQAWQDAKSTKNMHVQCDTMIKRCKTIHSSAIQDAGRQDKQQHTQKAAVAQ